MVIHNISKTNIIWRHMMKMIKEKLSIKKAISISQNLSWINAKNAAEKDEFSAVT